MWLSTPASLLIVIALLPACRTGDEDKKSSPKVEVETASSEQTEEQEYPSLDEPKLAIIGCEFIADVPDEVACDVTFSTDPNSLFVTDMSGTAEEDEHADEASAALAAKTTAKTGGLANQAEKKKIADEKRAKEEAAMALKAAEIRNIQLTAAKEKAEKERDNKLKKLADIEIAKQQKANASIPNICAVANWITTPDMCKGPPKPDPKPCVPGPTVDCAPVAGGNPAPAGNGPGNPATAGGGTAGGGSGVPDWCARAMAIPGGVCAPNAPKPTAPGGGGGNAPGCGAGGPTAGPITFPCPTCMRR